MSGRVTIVGSLVLLSVALGVAMGVLLPDLGSAGRAETRPVVLRVAVSSPASALAATARRQAGKGPHEGAARAPLQRSRGGTRPKALPTTMRRPRRGRSFAIAEVTAGRRVRVYSSPGRVGTTVGPKTEFGSSLAFAVVRRRGGWLGVASPTEPNGRLGWIRRNANRVELDWTRYSLAVDLSQHRLRVRYGNVVVRDVSVTIGAPATATPPGRYGVTDRLLFDEDPAYGCCALALSGRQTRLPEDWSGGDRLAIHGTSGFVGGAESHGCIRADERTMRFLMTYIPLGTPVFVRP